MFQVWRGLSAGESIRGMEYSTEQDSPGDLFVWAAEKVEREGKKK